MMFGMLGKETMNIEELLAAAEQMLHVIWRVFFALPKSLSCVLYRLFHFGNHTFVSRSGSRRDRSVIGKTVATVKKMLNLKACS